jgi:hypothetical protein
MCKPPSPSQGWSSNESSLLVPVFGSSTTQRLPAISDVKGGQQTAVPPAIWLTKPSGVGSLSRLGSQSQSPLEAQNTVGVFMLLLRHMSQSSPLGTLNTSRHPEFPQEAWPTGHVVPPPPGLPPPPDACPHLPFTQVLPRQTTPGLSFSIVPGQHA